MDYCDKKSILQMARGAIQERADYEITKILDNILDPNTSANAARKLSLTLTLKPDSERRNIAVGVVVKSTLAPTNPVVTSLYVADKDTVVEMTPQIPGQFDMDGVEEAPAPMLRLIVNE